MRGWSVILLIQGTPRSFLVISPTASSSYASTRKPAFFASHRKVSMWQLETEATKASSGSTAAALEYGAGTTAGDAEAGTTCPPSKLQLCARENFPCRNVSLSDFQLTVALCWDMRLGLAAPRSGAKLSEGSTRRCPPTGRSRRSRRPVGG